MNIPAINNRPLELRFWHTERATMYKVDDVTHYDVHAYLEDENGKYVNGWLFSLEEGILSQYTGMTDHNGNKIWEGDVLMDQIESEWEGRENVPVCYYFGVVFRFGMFGMVNTPLADQSDTYFTFIIDPHKTPCNTTGQSPDVLVVGNIHQHRNLLRMGALAPVIKLSHLTISTDENRHF